MIEIRIEIEIEITASLLETSLAGRIGLSDFWYLNVTRRDNSIQGTWRRFQARRWLQA